MSIAKRRSTTGGRTAHCRTRGFGVYSSAATEEGSAFSIYLRDVGQTQLLSATEEAELALRVRAGDEEARQRMIKANLLLVVTIARDYEHYGVPLLDLVGEGNIGLMKAVERFDPGKGARLSTYAACWINQAIRNALLKQSRTIRLPVHITGRLRAVRRTNVELSNELGREPTDDEIAERLGTPAAGIRLVREVSARVVSLDDRMREQERSGAFNDGFQDQQADTPYQSLVKKADATTVHSLLERLSEREATILEMHFGLNGREPMTLEAIGQRCGVTRERVRQIESTALKRLRIRCRRSGLEPI